MKLEQRLVVPATRDKLWGLLMDMPRLGRCFPGVEQVTRVDDQNYQGIMRVRVGPVTLNMSGTIQVLEQDNDRWHASLRLDGAERRVGGAVHAAMQMDLIELAQGGYGVGDHQRYFLPGKTGRTGPTRDSEKGGLGNPGIRP